MPSRWVLVGNQTAGGVRADLTEQAVSTFAPKEPSSRLVAGDDEARRP